MLSLIYLFFLHCICMVILEPFQFSDSKKGFWQKLKRNVWSRSQNLILVPVECFRQDIQQSFVRQKKWRRPHVLCQSYCWRSFAMTYHNSRVRRVNSFQTSLFLTQDYEIYFFDPQEEVIWHILSKSLSITGAISKFSQSCQIGGSAENTAGICFLIGNSWKLDFWP